MSENKRFTVKHGLQTPDIVVGTQASKATLTYTTNTARTYTIPDAGANANFVMSAGNQTIAGTKTFSSAPVINASLGIRAASTSSPATHIPIFTADPTSTTRTLVTRTPAQLRGDIGAEPSFSKGSLVKGARITLTGTLTNRLVGTDDVTITADPTNIAQGTRTSTTVPITSSTGTGATLSAATTTLAGVMSSDDKTKLNNIQENANNYSLPAATSTVRGGIELGSDTQQTVAANIVTTSASRTYALQVNSDGQGVINVPWTDTTYTAGNGISLSGTTLSLTAITAGDSTVGALRYNGTTRVAGQMYGGTTNPSATTRLNYDGYLHATQFAGPLNGTATNVTGTVAVANGGTGATTNTAARTNLGATTLGSNLFTITNPSAIRFPRFNADNTVSSLDAAAFRTAIGAGTSSTTGTVTSVNGTGTVSGLTLTGTVTSSGNLTLGGTLSVLPSNFASQTANTFLSAPNGTAGVPTFRTIVANDIPTLNQNTTGTSSGVVRTVTGTTSAELVRGNMGDNDQARILVGATGTDAGFLEIATADNGNEPIHVRQYTGTFTSLQRTATLLDGSGNTTFPGTVTGTSFNSITGLGSSSPLINGTVAVGTSTLVSRQDHVHPVDTSRAAVGQTMHIGTTAVTINRASGALTLAGLTLTTPNIGAATGSSLLATGEVSGAFLGVENTTSTNGRGLSLYGGGIDGQPTYGIMFQGTATFGTYGGVSADWATYFTMNNAAGRGWIFKTSTGTAGNVASINTAGAATFASDVTVGGNLIVGTQASKATISYGTNTARTYTIPNAGANADFVMTAGNQVIAGTKTFRSGTGGTRFEQASTQDAVQLLGRAGGTGSFAVTFTPTTLTANRTVTLPNATGTLAFTDVTQTFSGNNTFSGANTFSNANAITLSNTTAGVIRFNSTASRTANLFTDATVSGSTKIINIGTGGASGSTTNINMGSATTTSTSTVTVNGTLTAVDVNSTSDQRMKDNIVGIENGLDLISKMRGVRYTWKNNGTAGVGVVAQEVEQVLPEVVSTSGNIKTVSYGNIVGVLIEAIKEQQTQIELQKEEIEQLKKRMLT